MQDQSVTSLGQSRISTLGRDLGLAYSFLVLVLLQVSEVLQVLQLITLFEACRCSYISDNDGWIMF